MNTSVSATASENQGFEITIIVFDYIGGSCADCHRAYLSRYKKKEKVRINVN